MGAGIALGTGNIPGLNVAAMNAIICSAAWKTTTLSDARYARTQIASGEPFTGGNFRLLEQQAEGCQNDKESKIKGRKQQHIMACFSVVLLAVLPEGNQAGKGGNQCAYTANVDTQQQMLIAVCKLGQQNRRGNIADYLTGQDRHKQRVFFQEEGK